MKFLKALVVLMVLSLPFIYAFNVYTRGTWEVASQVTPLGQFPTEVRESSGLTKAPETGTYYTHSDHKGGAKPVLFKISETGKLLKTYLLSGASNQDWEDITSDDQNHLYIADTGNNNGKRSELQIYRVNASNPGKAETIRFRYDDKPEAGKSKKGKKDKNPPRNFDSEAIFWNNGSLFLVTKDRSNSNNAHLFKLPDSPGTHTARLIETKDIKQQITGAGLSPDGKHLILLSVGKLHIFNVSGSGYLHNDPKIIDLGNVGQTEGLVFKDNNTLIFTNEAGQIFKYNL